MGQRVTAKKIVGGHLEKISKEIQKQTATLNLKVNQAA